MRILVTDQKGVEHELEGLRPLVPAGVVYVAESGIHDPRQMVELAEARVDSALIGESLVRAPDPAARLRSLFEAGQRAAVPR